MLQTGHWVGPDQSYSVSQCGKSCCDYGLTWLTQSLWENEDVKFRLKWKKDVYKISMCLFNPHAPVWQILLSLLQIRKLTLSCVSKYYTQICYRNGILTQILVTFKHWTHLTLPPFNRLKLCQKFKGEIARKEFHVSHISFIKWNHVITVCILTENLLRF